MYWFIFKVLNCSSSKNYHFSKAAVFLNLVTILHTMFDCIIGTLFYIVIFMFAGTFPIDTTKTRLQIQGGRCDTGQVITKRYRGMFHALFKISHEEGIRALYFGWVVDGSVLQLVISCTRRSYRLPIRVSRCEYKKTKRRKMYLCTDCNFSMSRLSSLKLTL